MVNPVSPSLPDCIKVPNISPLVIGNAQQSHSEQEDRLSELFNFAQSLHAERAAPEPKTPAGEMERVISLQNASMNANLSASIRSVNAAAAQLKAGAQTIHLHLQQEKKCLVEIQDNYQELVQYRRLKTFKSQLNDRHHKPPPEGMYM